MRTLARDERGSVFTQIAVVIIGPLVMLILAGAALSAIRTGSGVTEALTRNAQSQIMFADFKSSISSATTITVVDAGTLTVTREPGVVPPGVAPAAVALEDTCVTTTWQLVDDGLRNLTQTVHTHEADCASPVQDESIRTFTGLSPDTTFMFENPAGRSLALEDGTLTAEDQPAPLGVGPKAWASTHLGAVTLDGTVQEMFSDRDVLITAVLTPRIAP